MNMVDALDDVREQYQKEYGHWAGFVQTMEQLPGKLDELADQEQRLGRAMDALKAGYEKELGGK